MQLPAHREDPGIGYVAGSLVVSVFFSGMAGGVAYPTLPRLGSVLDIAPLVVGLILSVHGVSRLLVNAPVGSLLDRVGTRRPVVAGFLLLTVAPFGYVLGLAPDPVGLSPSTVFLPARATWGVGTALVTVGGFAMVTHVTTVENRGRWLGYMMAGLGFGLPVGLVAGGVVADLFGIREAFLLAGGVVALSTLLAAVFLPDVTPDVERSPGLRAVPAIVRSDRRVVVVSTANLAGRFLGGVLLSTVVLYTADHGLAIGGLSESGVSGVVLAAFVLCSSASNVVAGRYSDALENRIRVVLPAIFLGGAGLVLLASVPTLAGVAGGVVVAGLGGGATGPPLLAYLGDISPEADVGKFGGVYKVFGDVGTVLGPVVALPLGATIGFAAEYLVCAGVAALTGLLIAGTLLSAPATPKPELAD